MYSSRIHIGNGQVAVAVDSLTGELLEFVDEQSGENLIKNAFHNLKQPFRLLGTYNGRPIRLFAGTPRQMENDPDLKPAILRDAEAEQGPGISVSYRKLTDGQRTFDLSVVYTVRLPVGQSGTEWRMEMTCREAGLAILDLRFPCLNGIYFGEHWEDDTLVFPYLAGIRIPDPVGVFAQASHQVEWIWQDYRSVYSLNKLASGPDADGLYGLECDYAGNLSMTWLDYHGHGAGLYFACHDPVPRVISLRADTYGPARPGMNFCCIHHPPPGVGDTWASPLLVATLHEGDWHRGADLYRAFRLRQGYPAARRPPWLDRSPGLVAHYDFKYQNGGIVHRFRDIPRLLAEARDLGLNHLLFAGWHRGGFDCGFPLYEPDEDLGSPHELETGVRSILDSGGHVTFYLNARLANLETDAADGFIPDNAVILQDGTLQIESYGRQDIRFAAMCNQSPGWPARLKEAVRHILDKLGGDGVYLDQVSMAPTCTCCASSHGHGHDEWNQGYRSLLSDMIRQREAAHPDDPVPIFIEGVSDAYGNLCSGQLVSTFFYEFCAFPELFKYTFPEQLLVDMAYPRIRMAMRPVHVGQASTRMINRSFVNGTYFWIYDLEEDNTFTRDPVQHRYLKAILALRAFWLDRFGHGIFRDTDGLREIRLAMVRRFDLQDGMLLACARESPDRAYVAVVIPSGEAARVRAYVMDDGRAREIEPDAMIRDGLLHIELPSAPVSLLHIVGGIGKNPGTGKARERYTTWPPRKGHES